MNDDSHLPEQKELATGIVEDSLFMRACRLEPVSRPPVWLMRQAGRYLPEYRAIRNKTTFLELCKNPKLSSEVMLATVDRLGVDAAIIFSDLLPLLQPMGLDLEFAAGEGPIIHNPLRSREDLDRFHELVDVDSLSFVFETVHLTRAGLQKELPVIGFAGAPFTLAGYAIEGGTSRNWLHTKRLMLTDPDSWHELMERLARTIARYLHAQFDAGANAVQVFDSWVGCLSPEHYKEFVLPHSRAVFESIAGRGPAIHFAAGTPDLLPLAAEAGGTVMGIDWRTELDHAWKQVGYDRGVQGNLDPAVLHTTPDVVRRRTEDILARVGGRPGHIMNLGHGILPETPVENVLEFISTVKQK